MLKKAIYKINNKIKLTVLKISERNMIIYIIIYSVGYHAKYL